MSLPVTMDKIRFQLVGLSGWLEAASSREGFTDEEIEKAIPKWLRRFERETQLRLSPIQIVSNPDGTYNNDALTKASDEIDALPLSVEAPYAFYRDQLMGQYLLTTLRQRPVIEVQRVRMMLGPSMNVITFPTEWLRVDARMGTLRVVPISGGVTSAVLMSNMGLMAFSVGGSDPFPQGISVDYTAGLRTNWWNADEDDYDPEWADLADILEQYCALRVLERIAQMYDPGRRGKMVSAFGVSQSLDYTRFEDRKQELATAVAEYQQMLKDQNTPLLLGVL